MYVWMCGCIHLYIYVCGHVCICLCFLLFNMYKKKVCVKKIHKVVGHHMSVIDILVCGTYDNFQNKNCKLDIDVMIICVKVVY
jgi:branched-subunit amino acid transport protein AzlD